MRDFDAGENRRSKEQKHYGDGRDADDRLHAGSPWLGRALNVRRVNVGAAVADRLVKVGVAPRQRLEGDAAWADELENGSFSLRLAHGAHHRQLLTWMR